MLITTESLSALALVVDGDVNVSKSVPTGDGWRITLPNGAQLSIQRSEFHHCDTQTAETAAMWRNNNTDWIWREQVRGHQTFSDIAVSLRQLAALNPGESLCHCGGRFGDSDHCAECGCEEFECYCDPRVIA